VLLGVTSSALPSLSLIDEVIGQLMRDAEPITGQVAWLKESLHGSRTVKLEGEVLDALLRYSKRPGKKVVKEV
jgi:hypothetical protein